MGVVRGLKLSKYSGHDNTLSLRVTIMSQALMRECVCLRGRERSWLSSPTGSRTGSDSIAVFVLRGEREVVQTGACERQCLYCCTSKASKLIRKTENRRCGHRRGGGGALSY
jgi:hypothetical protein